MTGYREILELRMQGYMPASLWIYDLPFRYSLDTAIQLSPEDLPEAIDWRVVTGLMIFIQGVDSDRLERIVAACRGLAKVIWVFLEAVVPNEAGEPDLVLQRISTGNGGVLWQI